MNELNTINKEKYFEEFALIIKDLKEGKEISNNIDSFYINIKDIENLNLQDIITYMLYCFQVIELTQKWKLKKIINYDLFIENMQTIYNEIFCDANSTFKNKIIAATSFGCIIEKTINYNIENQIQTILVEYLKCISSKKVYLQNNDLTLLRGNLFCQIYNTLKDNNDINDLCNIFYKKLNTHFNYEKYMNTALKYFETNLNKNNLTYYELNNLLSFKTYNKLEIDSKELQIVIQNLLKKYKYDYFDKNIFIYILKIIFQNIISEKNLNINIEFTFSNSNKKNNQILIDYNSVDYNFINNLSILKNIFIEINKIKYENENIDEYLQLQKIKDTLIKEKKSENNSILNYSNIIEFISINEYSEFLKKMDKIGYENYFDGIINDIKTEYKKINDDYSEECYIMNSEIFEQQYNEEQIKMLIKKYPLLSLEYNENGTYKTVATIMKEKTEISNEIKNKDELEKIALLKKQEIYNNLIKYRNCNLYSLLNDYYSLLLIDSVDSNLIKEKEITIKKILPNLIEDKITFTGKINKTEIDEIYNEYINPCIKKISQNRVNSKSFESTKDFLNFEKSNADNYLGICKLQEILENNNQTN